MDFSNPASPLNPLNPLNPMNPLFEENGKVVGSASSGSPVDILLLWGILSVGIFILWFFFFRKL